MSLAEDIVALGSQAPGVISGLVKVVKTVGPVLPTINLVLEDPAFPQVIERIKTLHEIEASKPSAPSTPGFPAPAPATGIGLNRAVPILDAVIFARRNPWVPWVVGGLLFLIPIGIGYKLGSRRR